MIILYTDGITEARDEQNKMLTLSVWTEIIKKNHNLDTNIMLQNLMNKLKEYMQKAEQYDDITLVIIKKT